MRKVIAGFLIFIFSLSVCLTPVPAFAETGMSAREAAKLVKSKFNIPANITKFESQYSERDGRGKWNLNWIGDDFRLLVGVDTISGDIVEFNHYRNNEVQSRIPKISEKEALDKATTFLQKAIPQNFNSLQLKKTNSCDIPANRYTSDYHFVFNRIINNIPYINNTANIRVSGQTGEIENYHLEWDYTAKFPKVEKTLSLENAKNILVENNKMELMYYSPRWNDNKDKMYLVYGVREPDTLLINALTGELHYNNYYPYPVYDLVGGMGEKSVNEDLTPEELKEIETVESLLSKEAAANKILQIINVDKQYKLTDARLSHDYRDEHKKIWSFDWQLNDSLKNDRSITASIDAQSGEIISFYKWSAPENYNKKPVYSINDAEKIATEFIQKLQPDKIGQIKQFDSNNESYPNEKRRESFNYVRVYNGIPYYDDGFRVTVDMVTGEIISYHMNWRDCEFPKPNNIISLDKALSTLVSSNPISKDYIKVQKNENKKNLNGEIGLYYHFEKNEPALVDAFTGTLLTNTGDEYKENKKAEFTDITGHPAEKDIRTLLDLGIIEGNNDKYYPDKNITNAEFIKMLILAIGATPGEGQTIEKLDDEEWYTPYYQTAVSRKIIFQESLPDPNQTISRIDAARFMLRACKLDKIAELEGIYTIPALDSHKINSADMGYAAISLKLSLLKSVNGEFCPEGSLSRGDTASTIINYINIFFK